MGYGISVHIFFDLFSTKRYWDQHHTWPPLLLHFQKKLGAHFYRLAIGVSPTGFTFFSETTACNRKNLKRKDRDYFWFTNE